MLAKEEARGCELSGQTGFSETHWKIGPGMTDNPNGVARYVRFMIATSQVKL